MKILGINHIGMAPKDAAVAKEFFGNILKLENLGEEDVESQKTLTTMFLPAENAGRFELLEGTSADSPISKFLEKRGAGIHHVAITVDNIEKTLQYLKSQSVELIDSEPRNGAHNTRIIFVHPRATGGILVEFVQELEAK